MLVSKLLRITLNNNVIRSTYMISCFLLFKELSHLMLNFISVLFSGIITFDVIFFQIFSLSRTGAFARIFFQIMTFSGIIILDVGSV